MQKNIIVLSSCKWGDILQRPHHMARALRSLDHSVHYIDSISSADLASPYLESKTLARQVDGLWIYQVQKQVDTDIQVDIQRLIQSLIDSTKHESILVLYLPRYINYVQELTGNYKIVYDCVDDHTDLDYSYWSTHADIEWENHIMKRADLVLTTSTSLYLNKSLGIDKVILSKNAVDPKDFSFEEKCPIPEELLAIPSPRVCYVGAVDKWFDQDLFYALVEFNPDISFVVIGPVRPQLLTHSFPNLYLLGIKPHSDIKQYLIHMDLGIIPFKDDIDLIINCDPIKKYEYAISGLPVISTALPELYDDEPYLIPCATFDQFQSAIRLNIGQRWEPSRLDRYIGSNTWLTRASEMMHYIDYPSELSGLKINTLQQIQSNWNKNHAISAPIVDALHGLSYIETDSNMALSILQDAVQNSNSLFVEKTLILCLVLTDRLEEAIDLALNGRMFNDLMKAELIAYLNLEDAELIRIQLLNGIRRFDQVRHALVQFNRDETFKKFLSANYFVTIGHYDAAIPLYQDISNSGIREFSPLFNMNMSILLKHQGLLQESQQIHIASKSMVDEYLNRPSQLVN
ncbi:hypothetical protein [Cohnella mopanensis]|uniref:hypothetical protein n=1 Tax=Cohnella mopanensis TaxID=2911966 RepID=UPI001EF89315|nr:hypothetical protein [Cohnella mopanensis]